ncbi:hypothetical protein [Salinisphaera sp.]|uniref:hypothetical protein n=1 Tax=Salinisphaera sp. TaxID=1914330 RepID=UPI002D7992DA|nr:hypothetical protein [Salinisphaera sp.]HET7313684.1 hypothetical protein [Salinisphaera sp.]
MRARLFVVSIRLSGLLLGAALLTTGCAARAPESGSGRAAASPAPRSTAPAEPSQWIGRWPGSGAAALTIMPNGDGSFRIDRRNKQGITTDYTASAAGGRLYFRRLGKTFAIRPGRGDETGDPALAGLTDCLLIVPDGGGYCRHVNTADALPLARGAYVEIRTDCGAARPGDTLFFTGTAIARPGQRGCRASLAGQQGMIFHLNDHCAAPKATSGGGNETISVPDRHHMAVRVGHRPVTLYRYCAIGLLPPALQHYSPHSRGHDR